MLPRSGWAPEDRLGAGRDLRIDQGTLLGDPVVQLAMADPQTAQLIERPGRLGVGQLGDEEERPLPDAQAVLHAGLQTEELVEVDAPLAAIGHFDGYGVKA